MRRLRDIAEAATPGPWDHEADLDPERPFVGTEIEMGAFGPGSRKYRDKIAEFDSWERSGQDGCEEDDQAVARRDARFVATFDPPMALALIDAVEAAEDGCECPNAAPHRPTCRVGAALARVRGVSA